MGAHLGVRVSTATMERLEASADQLGVRISDLVRLSIHHGLAAAHDEIANAIEQGGDGGSSDA